MLFYNSSVASVSNNNKQKNLNTKNLEKWVEHIKNIRLPIFIEIQKYIHFHGKIIEIGAGICWLSANLSRLSDVSHISAIEHNPERIDLAKKYFFKVFQASSNKIAILEKDFHKLPFPDCSIDFIVVDAALHHADNLPVLLKEANRVLKNKGLLIAIREPILPSFSPLLIWRKYTFGWVEKIKGETEHIYSKKQWQKFFKDAGFSLNLHPIFTHCTFKEKIVNSSILSWANGILFCRYFLVGSKVDKQLKIS